MPQNCVRCVPQVLCCIITSTSAHQSSWAIQDSMKTLRGCARPSLEPVSEGTREAFCPIVALRHVYSVHV